MSWRVGLLVAVSVGVATPTAARANGRFPASVDVRVRPGDDQHILVPLTFGLALSTDDGNSFQWVCEDAVGYGGTFDPDYAVSPDGTLWASNFNGLRVSRDGGCVWTFVGGPLAGVWVEDVEVTASGGVWATTSAGGLPNDVYFSATGADEFAPMGLASSDTWWKTIRVAPGDVARVYVTGYRVAGDPRPDGGVGQPRAFLLRSDTGGLDTGTEPRWVELGVDSFAFGPEPQLSMLGVMPDDPDVAFAQVHGATLPDGDAIYRTADGGRSWTRVVELSVPLGGFAITAGGGTLIAGTVGNGAWVSTDRGVRWTRDSDAPQMACLSERADGALFACGSNWDPDFFALGRSTDGGASWSKVVRFSELAGPLRCDSGTVQRDTCEAIIWPSIVEQFGIGRADAGPTPTDAGTSSEPDARPLGTPDGGAASSTGAGGRGCSCKAGNRGATAALGGLLAVVLVVRRRRC